MDFNGIITLSDTELQALLRQKPASLILSKKTCERVLNHFVEEQLIDHLNVLAAWTKEYSLDWNNLNEDYLTPLGVCIEKNLTKSASALLKLDHVRVNQCGYHDNEQHLIHPAEMCIENERKDMYKLILKSPRTEIHARLRGDTGEHTILSSAIDDDDTFYLEELMKRNDLDINQDIQEKSPIHHVIINNSPDHLRLILKHPHINLSKHNTEDDSPLIAAIRVGSEEMTHILLKNGADPGELNYAIVQELMDPYHLNIFFCHTINSREDAMERYVIGTYLLDMGIRPRKRSNIQTYFEAVLPSNAHIDLTDLRKTTARLIYSNLNSGIRSLGCLARGSIFERLRDIEDGKTITDRLDTFTTRDLPHTVLPYLKFKTLDPN